MLKENMMQEIQDLKLSGYTVPEIARHFKERDGKTPSEKTIRKYFNMDNVPEVANANLQKDKVFDQEPFRSAIIKIVNNSKGRCYSSSVYDVLIERFIENGTYEQLPGNEQTLRNYIRFLTENGDVTVSKGDKRTYDYVFDTPPGKQMLIDFGQYKTGGIIVHFLCLLLRYSRMMFVLAQDHKFNAEEACRGIYRGFVKLGGRPEQLVIDQDAVFVASETYGEVIPTDTFNSFLSEQELDLWVCRKSDPESKGPVENMVGFVKKNFFSARTITCIDDVWKSLPGWLVRKNKRTHQETFCVPVDVFDDVEKETLLPVIPSLFENSPLSFQSVEVKSMPYIQYKSSKYSVGQKYCFSTVLYKATGNILNIYTQNRELICSHKINPCRGSKNQLDEHKKDETSKDLPVIIERLRGKWNCYSFQHFINGFKKENGSRHICQQLGAVEKFLEKENPSRDMVATVMKLCCEKWRYRFSQFTVVYERVKAGHQSPSVIEFSDVQKRDLAVYQKAFEERCESGIEG